MPIWKYFIKTYFIFDKIVKINNFAKIFNLIVIKKVKGQKGFYYGSKDGQELSLLLI